MHGCKTYLLALACFIFWLRQPLLAQRLSEATADSVSYRMYVDENWKSLELYGQGAIELGYDNYYMRIRTGVACFERGHYRNAITHLRKALYFNNSDELAMNYLYLCYLYTERFEDAKTLSRRFNAAQATFMKTTSLSPIDFVNAEFGVKHSDSSNLFKDPVFATLDVGHSISRRVFLLHSFSYFGQSESRFTVSQFQYYLKSSIMLRPGLQLALAGQVLAYQANVNGSTVVTQTVQGQQPPPPPPPPPPGGGPPPPPPPAAPVQTIETVQPAVYKRDGSAFVWAAALTQYSRLFNYSLGFTTSNRRHVQQYQLNAGLSFFPLKNNRLSIGLLAYHHTEDAFKTNKIALVPSASAYVTKKFFLTFSYLNNTGRNVIENTGYFINNSVDYTTDRYTALASYNILKKVWLYAMYGYEVKKQNTQGFIYHYNIFLTGLKIIP